MVRRMEAFAITGQQAQYLPHDEGFYYHGSRLKYAESIFKEGLTRDITGDLKRGAPSWHDRSIGKIFFAEEPATAVLFPILTDPKPPGALLLRVHRKYLKEPVRDTPGRVADGDIFVTHDIPKFCLEVWTFSGWLSPERALELL